MRRGALRFLFFVSLFSALILSLLPAVETEEEIEKLLNSSDKQEFIEEYNRIEKETEDVRRLIRILTKSASINEKAPRVNYSVLHFQKRRAAELSELIGDVETAQKYYEQASYASREQRDFNSLLRSALLLIEMGKYEKASFQAEMVISAFQQSDSQYSRAVLVGAVAAYYSGEPPPDYFVYFSSSTKTRLPAEHLYLQYRFARRDGSDKKAQRAADYLKELYPKSPEAGLVDQGVSILQPRRTPPELLSSVGTPASANGSVTSIGSVTSAVPDSASAETQSPEKKKLYSVQVGSFRDSENAEELKKVLEKEDFIVQIREVRKNDNLYYRVVVPAGKSRGEASRIVLQLKDRGFEGFLLIEAEE
ncbi:MAG: SPOR domain-containing protein [Spirochaetales bacterium]|nr:SPOR domain-containing protein [Spirochaetales bacterium]